LLVYQALSQTIVADVSFLSENEQDKWLLFCQQFRAEMDGSSVKKIENNRLYSEKDGKINLYWLSPKMDFRKSSENGKGYHPMLLDLKSMDMSYQVENHVLTMHLQWRSGKQRTFYYAF